MANKKTYSTQEVTQAVVKSAIAESGGSVSAKALHERATPMGMIMPVTIVKNDEGVLDSAKFRQIAEDASELTSRYSYEKANGTFYPVAVVIAGEDVRTIEDMPSAVHTYLRSVSPQHIMSILDAYDDEVKKRQAAEAEIKRLKEALEFS